jgi:hypothetical protein
MQTLADAKPTGHDKDNEIGEISMDAYGKISSLSI